MESQAIITSPDPGMGRIKALVLDSVPSPLTKRAYGQALDAFLSWYAAEQPGPLSKAIVQRYRVAHLDKLSPSSVNKHLSAIRKLVNEAADNGLLPLDVAAAIRRVKGAKRSGTRTGNWLTQVQAERLLNQINTRTLRGKRDQALFALLLGAGLRRGETATLTMQHVQQREGRWVLVDLLGKHGRVRSVPIASWIKAAIDRWTLAAGIKSDRLFLPINRGGNISGTGMSDQAIYEALTCYTEELGFKCAPHDMRRTFAKLAREGNATLEQIQLTLGHASIQTTERYLGTRQNWQDSPSDRVGLQITSEEAPAHAV